MQLSQSRQECVVSHCNPPPPPSPEAADLRAQLEVAGDIPPFATSTRAHVTTHAVVARESLGMELRDRVFEVTHSLARKEAELENAERRCDM